MDTVKNIDRFGNSLKNETVNNDDSFMSKYVTFYRCCHNQTFKTSSIAFYWVINLSYSNIFIANKNNQPTNQPNDDKKRPKNIYKKNLTRISKGSLLIQTQDTHTQNREYIIKVLLSSFNDISIMQESYKYQ